MDYSKFGIEDFLCDTSFLEYCLGNNEKSVAFWTNWLNDHPEKVKAAASARSLYFTLNGNIGTSNFHADYEVFKNAFSEKVMPVASAITARAALVKIVPVRKWSRAIVIGITSMAACALIAIGLFVFSPQKSKSIVRNNELSYLTPLGKKRTIKLPDGSLVTLNGGSQLKVMNGFNLKRRDVVLTGEGYFVVVHNAAKPFVVHTERINIKDIGTEFNVKAYSVDRTTEASLLKGLVEITVNGHSANHRSQNVIVLLPNKKFVIDNTSEDWAADHKTAKKLFAISHITANPATNSVVETDWTENKLSFYNSSIDDIALQMERWYGVKIVITNPAVKAYRFTATFDHEDIIQVLEALKLSGNINYRKEDNVISIY